MTSGYIPAKDEPNPDEILEALREAAFENYAVVTAALNAEINRVVGLDP